MNRSIAKTNPISFLWHTAAANIAALPAVFWHQRADIAPLARFLQYSEYTWQITAIMFLEDLGRKANGLL
jgi:hypothetical protein